MIMTFELAKEIVGSDLGQTIKMPCPSISTPATDCQRGQKLAQIPGTICSKCYVDGGFYNMPTVRNAMKRRLDAIQNPLWTPAMTYLINVHGNSYFRWHDSGSIQSVEHLNKINDVCLATPKVSHWLPDREFGYVSTFMSTNKFADNLCVRLSADMIDGPPPAVAKTLGLPTSQVLTSGFTCPASIRHAEAKARGEKSPYKFAKCLDCRACWDKNIQNISYGLH